MPKMVQRIPTGIPNLDHLIEGGFPKGSLILLAGYPGTGKTILAQQFIYQGVSENKSKGIYVCFTETKRRLLANTLRLGWDFEHLEEEKLLHVLDLPVVRETGLKANMSVIIENINAINANRLVIDSFNALTMSFKETTDLRIFLHLLYKLLQTIHCTTILVWERPWGSEFIGNGIIEFIADGIVLLETYFDHAGVLRRTMRILKMRETDHTKDISHYDITHTGVLINPMKM
jgi:circadian clock protein KaiC